MNARDGWNRRDFLMGVSGMLVALNGCRREPSMVGRDADGGQQAVGVYHWSGMGFGIDMTMEIHGVDASSGEQLGGRCERVIAMLEEAFSLYLENSELSRLNRERKLDRPSGVFLDLLGRAEMLAERTLGYYQPAIHGVWQWLQDHDFTISDPEAWRRQCEEATTAAIERGEDGSLHLTRPLTQLSMNAVGQGYLADLVTAVLRKAGVARALLHLGETAALGDHPSGRPWRMAVMGTGAGADVVGEVELSDAGLAVSANEPGRLLIDPVAGGLQTNERVAAVVSAEGATVADAFATAFAVAPRDRWHDLAVRLQRGGSCRVKVWEANKLAFGC